MKTVASLDRARIISCFVLLAILGVTIPVGASFYLAKKKVEETDRRRSVQLAVNALTRANILLRSVVSVLHAVEAVPGPVCSDEHIRKMRALTIGTRGVEETGYAGDGIVKCMAWGFPERQIKMADDDFSLPNGLKGARRVKPSASAGKELMRLRYDAHYVLIDPTRFVDIIAEPSIRIAVASRDGHLLSALNYSGDALPAKLLRTDGTGVDDDGVYAVRQDGNFKVFAQVEHRYTMGMAASENASLLVLGALIAGACISMLIWRTRKKFSPMAKIEAAVKRQEFFVHYQPLVDLHSGKCVGAEALVRWQRADGSYIPPDMFIPLAEQSGLILPITDQVIAAVVADLCGELRSNPDLHVAINICAEDIRTGRILDVLEAALDGSGIAPDQIWLEATERGFLDADAARATLLRARELGYTIAIDDFGTGYSSLSCLEGLPLDVLKIDKSFVDSTGSETAPGLLIEHIIAIGKSLRLNIIAEGIETEEQAEFLRQRGVEYGQGWLYAKALPADEFIAFVRKKNSLPLPEGAEA